MSTQININPFYQTVIAQGVRSYAQANATSGTINVNAATPVALTSVSIIPTLLVPNSGFTLTPGTFTLTYTGATTQNFKYNLAVNGTTIFANNTVTSYISHNTNLTQGVLPGGSFNSSGFGLGTAPSTVVGFVTLATNDTIQIAVVATLADTLTLTSAAIVLDQV